MKYKFTGLPDKIFPYLITGRVYDLTIKEVSKGPLGFLVGNTYPVIVSPIQCPYRNWDLFFDNWQEVRE